MSLTSRVARDNVQQIALQGFPGTLKKCEVCHGVTPTGAGPHGIFASTCMCGDADGNGIITISDAVYLINYIFVGGFAPNPICLGDADGNGLITISDAVFLINYIFAGGPAPHCP